MKDWKEPARAAFQSVDDRFRRQSLRERVLVSAMVAGAVFFSLDRLLIQPVASERARIRIASERSQADIEVLEAQLHALSRTAMSAEERKLADEADQLRRQIQEIQTQTDAAVASMVPPRAIVSVLEELLSDSNGLRLLHLASRPPERVGAPDAESGAEAEAASLDAALYRHGLTLEIEGSYRAAVDYVRRAESSPWNLLWERLEYRVEQFPKATITIELHTISNREEWIGV